MATLFIVCKSDHKPSGEIEKQYKMATDLDKAKALYDRMLVKIVQENGGQMGYVELTLYLPSYTADGEVLYELPRKVLKFQSFH